MRITTGDLVISSVSAQRTPLRCREGIFSRGLARETSRALLRLSLEVLSVHARGASAICAGGSPEGKSCLGVGSHLGFAVASGHRGHNDFFLHVTSVQILFLLLCPAVTSAEACLACAHDSDGSPPGCLSIGSTGQVVIHVYDRTSYRSKRIHH